MADPHRWRPYRQPTKPEKKRTLIIERDGDVCWLCGLPFTPDDPPTFDHFIPWSKSGSNKLRNLRLAHKLCNEQRGNRLQGQREPARVIEPTP